MPQTRPQLGNSSVVQTGRTYESRPLIRRVTVNDMAKQKQEEKELQKAEEAQNAPVISRLASLIRSAFTVAVTAKSIVMQQMLEDLRQREGIYEADVEQLINEQNGTKLFMRLTDVKCRALESWLKDIMLPSGERPYSIEPTPVPEISPAVIMRAQKAFVQDFKGRIAEQAGYFDESLVDPEDLARAEEQFEMDMLKVIKKNAKDAADKIENQVDDELVEGGWYKELSDFIEDFATYPSAFLEGPIFRRKKVLQWVPSEGTDNFIPIPVDKVVKEYERNSPFDVYPSPGARNIQQGHLCVRKRYNRSNLESFRGVDGYSTETINIILKKYANGYREFISYDTEIEDLLDRPQEWTDPEGRIDGIKFWGSIQGFTLREWGIPAEQIPDPFMEYPVIAHLVGSYVFGAWLNPHPLGHRNIHSASLRNKNDSVWGSGGVPRLMKDVQSICNSSARAMCNNSAMASGPQIWQYADLIPSDCDNTEITPWKIWEFSSENVKGALGKPMEFFQPTLIVGPLLELYDYFQKQASEVTGIPAYIYGSDRVGGAGKTATGLSMLMSAAAKGIRNAARNIDMGVISPSIYEHWLIIMLTRPDLASGDAKIVARASEYLVQAEAQQIRLSEFASATANNIDMEIMGVDGRAELLRQLVKSLKMNPEKIIPSKEDMISTQVNVQMEQMVLKLATSLKMPPEQLMAMLQAPQPTGQNNASPQQARPRALDAGGNPVAGQDVRMFNQ